MDALADFDREAALSAGIDPARVRAWSKIHEAYYGPTTSRQKQRLALEQAQRAGMSLDQLALIERRVAKFASARTRNKMRVALLAVRGNYKTLEKAAKELAPQPTKPARKQVTFSPSKNGTRTMTVTADERDLADFEHFLSQDLDPSHPAAPQLLKRFLAFMRGNPASDPGGPSDSSPGVPYAVPRPLLLLPLPDWVSIINGEGDEIELSLTDGTNMTGAEFLNGYFGTVDNGLEAAVFHPEHGAVNLYRTQRLANAKQRILARASMPVCPVPGCRRGADSCEIHHIKPWAKGGATNISNLAPLCRYHNRVNDDDPARRKRGHIRMRRGTPVWVSPRGYAVPNPHHNYKYAAMLSLYGRRQPV
ncbi:hypothetical protein GCM10027157_06810 [Corynebacterium aquatimens]